MRTHAIKQIVPTCHIKQNPLAEQPEPQKQKKYDSHLTLRTKNKHETWNNEKGRPYQKHYGHVAEDRQEYLPGKYYPPLAQEDIADHVNDRIRWPHECRGL